MSAMIGRASLACAVVCALAAAGAAQSPAETYVAHAKVKTAGGVAATAPVAMTITGWTSDTERNHLRDVLKSGGHPAFVKRLAAGQTLGTITIGADRFDAKYAYAQGSSKGRLITLVTAAPMFFLGGGRPGARPKGHHDLGVVTIEIDETGAGTGTVTPAASVKMSDSGALIVEDYSVELVTLPDVRKK